MATQPEFIESTAGKVAEELARRGIPPAQRVTITIEPDEPDDWIAKVRAFAAEGHRRRLDRCGY
jgi:acetylornithine deacetylase/succinyl-diaminopimelate desuccinylase-like protein